MKEKHSEIFDLYANLADANGLVKKAEDETNRKPDDRDIYRVKPNGEDEKDMVDQAHPDTFVAAPAYDKMNAIVENVKQRHDIMADIATNVPRGVYVHKRYVKARRELFDTLQKNSFRLERENHNPFALNLVTSCTEAVVNDESTFKKQALAPLVVAGIGVALLAINRLSSEFAEDVGVKRALDYAEEELKDLLEDSPQLSSTLNSILKGVSLLKSVYKKISQINISEPNTSNLQSIKDSGQQFENSNAETLVKYFDKLSDVFIEHLPKYISYIELMEDHTGDSFFGVEWEWARDLGDFVSQSNSEEAVTALKNLRSNLIENKKTVQQYIETIKDFGKKSMQEHLDEVEQEFENLESDFQTDMS